MRTTTSPEKYEWSNIDASNEPKFFVDYLQDVSRLEFAKMYKTASYQLLRLKHGDRILETGCGIGNDVYAMAKLVGPKGQVVGLDKSQTMIRKARSSHSFLPNVKFEVGDIESLQFANSAFDACRCDRVFVHLENPERALHEIIRVTKNSGRICVLDVDWETLVVDSRYRELTRNLLNLKCDNMKQGWIGRRLYGMFRRAELRNIIVSTATLVLDSFSLAARFYGLQELAKHAIQEGLLNEFHAREWLEDLRALDRKGQFFASSTGYAVVGNK